ncbi:hypothetical protein GCM10007276_31700 [Agaricicola taiwanensis]|uniref:Preprotein translocase subunit TatC n=1 Tax=Agaricicola taiwanensis TaxID=591372 RepID=A0A8J2YM55_9RHOB|nr:group III truncated hemoglobin [Agaricicola taiwanensis]GGE52365.1 hypothetical protein GCM10007276_31700 [Agaricicola taiwanensis]
MDGVLSEEQLRELVISFYGSVRRHPRLGPIFEAQVHDWEEHIDRLTRFWSSLMLGSGRYKGNPFAAHQPLAPQLDEALFQEWLGLWAEAADRHFPPSVSSALKQKAQRIASSLQAGLLFRCDAQTGAVPPARADH